MSDDLRPLPWKFILAWLLLGISSTIGIEGLLESQFENEILTAVVETIDQRSTNLTEIEKIDTALKICYYLQERRSEIFGKHKFQSQKTSHFKSSLESFYIGTGACGYYTLFAARVFQKMGYRPKIVQQNVAGRWGAHITMIIPSKTTGKFILVDPLYKHVFKNDSNSGCTLDEVKQNWSHLKLKVPKNYNPNYNYQGGWRHTNWNKFGFMSRSVYHLGCLILGKETMDSKSLRMWVIDPYRVQSVVSLTVAVFCLIVILMGFKRNAK